MPSPTVRTPRPRLAKVFGTSFSALPMNTTWQACGPGVWLILCTITFRALTVSPCTRSSRIRPNGSLPRIQMAIGDSALANAEGGQSMNLVKFSRNAAFTWYSSAGFTAWPAAYATKPAHRHTSAPAFFSNPVPLADARGSVTRSPGPCQFRVSASPDADQGTRISAEFGMGGLQKILSHQR